MKAVQRNRRKIRAVIGRSLLGFSIGTATNTGPAATGGPLQHPPRPVYYRCLKRRFMVWLVLTPVLAAQSTIENTGKPIRAAFDCGSEDLQASGSNCSEEEPC